MLFRKIPRLCLPFSMQFIIVVSHHCFHFEVCAFGLHFRCIKKTKSLMVDGCSVKPIYKTEEKKGRRPCDETQKLWHSIVISIHPSCNVMYIGKGL